MQRQHERVGQARQSGQRLLRAPNLTCAGQKNQHVAVGLGANRTAHGGHDLLIERALFGLVGVLDVDVEAPAG